MTNHKLKCLSLVTLFFMMWATTVFTFQCHPAINPLFSQYIVGYGSLIDEQSKQETDPMVEKNRPILIKGYQRSWGVHGNLPGLNATFLSVFENPSASFNGVIYKLPHANDIQQFDNRERIYCRKMLSADQLHFYTQTLPTKAQIWIYYSAKDKNTPPSSNFPIVQSYVDIFIRGCIKIGQKYQIKDFAKNCILSTTHWSTHWENDRIFPRRPFFYEPFASQIDALLKALLPEIFKEIKYK